MRYLASILAILGICSAPVYAEKAQNTVTAEEYAAVTSQQQNDRRTAQIALAPIHSERELQEYLSKHQENPLKALGEKGIERFISSLTFNSAGITGFSYAELTALEVRKAYAILELFGAQDSIVNIPFDAGDSASIEARELLRPIVPMDDHPGYRCTPPYTCSAATNAICLSTCSIP